MSTLLIGQSGGPTAVINASVVGAYKEAIKNGIKVLGCVNGIQGILNENFCEIDESIINTPAAYLGSVRYKITNEYEQILNIFKKYDIKYFLYIGGNDSADTTMKLAKYFIEVNYDCKVIGVPKTIDNDLTEIKFTPGYGSAAKYIATTMEELWLDTHVYDKGRVTVVEIMGRDAGWLTASTSIANLNGMGPDLIYLPEVPFVLNDFLNDVDKIYKQNKKVLVAVSEGIKCADGKYFLQSNDFTQNDAFGHLQLGGVAAMLAEAVNRKLGYPVRSIELNLPQRCAGHLVSLADQKAAYKAGSNAVKLCLKGYTGYLANYDLRKLIKIEDVAGKVKTFPIEWIVNNNQISPEYFEYVLPIIKGEVKTTYLHGIPMYAKRK